MGGQPIFEDTDADSSIIRRAEYLDPSYTPPEPVGRDEEVQQLAEALRPLARRRTPEHVLVHGPAGVGKTTVVEHVFGRLADETRVKPVTINCWQYNTRPSLLTELLIELGYPAPRKGKPVDELLSKLREWLEKNRSVAVALDEFDQLEAQAEVVYDLHEVAAEVENGLGMVMVSNRSPSQLSLDARSASRLSYRPVEFESYGPEELLGILEQRVEQAFYPGAVDESALETLAEHVAGRSGDCRRAMKLIRRIGREVEQQELSNVTEDTVERVVSGF